MGDTGRLSKKDGVIAPPILTNWGKAAGGEPSAIASSRWRYVGFALVVLVLVFIYLRPLMKWAAYAAGADLHSYVLLVPFVSAYLLKLRWRRLPRTLASSPVAGVLSAALGGAIIFLWMKLRAGSSPLSVNDASSLMIVSFVAFIIAAGFSFLGQQWMRAAAFPFAFLVLMAPIPDLAVDWLEKHLTLASANVADTFFGIAGIPAYREGVVFQLPNITLKVAQECSGIRSSLVLFITSLVAGELFLYTPWRRLVFSACIVPLAIARNAFRIVVLGWLCVHISPEMIHSPIHKRGGPLFFIGSIPFLLLLLWALRFHESPRKKDSDNAPANAEAQS